MSKPSHSREKLEAWVDRWLQANKDCEKAGDWRPLGDFYAPEATYGWNIGPKEDVMCVGVDEIRAGTTAFLGTIAGLHHTIVNEWNVGDDTIAELKVTYDRTDGQQVTIPRVTIFHTNAAGKIATYRVYFDVAPIYT